MPASSMSARRVTPCGGGLPTLARGCPDCRGSARPMRCPVVGRPCTEVLSSMARGIRRFDRWVRPGEDTEVIPAVKDDDDPGEIPVQDAEYDDEDAALETDLESQDADADLERRDDDDDRLAKLRSRALQVATYLWQRLVQLAAVVLASLARELRRRLPQVGRALRPRLTRLGAAILAGLLLCSSYPGFNWWWAAVIAFSVLAWVLTRPATTPVGGLGYGFLFGLAFYLPLIHWVSILVGVAPLLALVLVCALFPGIFGLLAVVVRQLPGWPIWFAVLWAAQEWLKCTVPFGGFPWGVVAAGQTDGPFLPLVRLGSVPLLSLGMVWVGCSAPAIALEIASWLLASRQPQTVDRPPAVVLPAICICLVF